MIGGLSSFFRNIFRGKRNNVDQKKDESVGVTKVQKRALPFLLAVVIFMQMLDTTILNTSLPAIADDFSISPIYAVNNY